MLESREKENKGVVKIPQTGSSLSNRRGIISLKIEEAGAAVLSLSLSLPLVFFFSSAMPHRGLFSLD